MSVDLISGMIAQLIGEIVSAQAPSGGFQSFVGSCTDENCFITALILLEIHAGVSPRLDDAITRALDFLEACEEPERPGAFRFYPLRLPSPRIPIGRITADADDTALAQLALIRHGRRGRVDAQRTLDQVIAPNRVTFLRGDEPSWVRRGAVRTWLTSYAYGNPVDCAVNSNVAALHAAAGESAGPCFEAGFEAVCATVNDAVRLTGGSPAHLRSLAPYYANILELRYAIERAVAEGASPLAASLDILTADPCPEPHWDRRRPICCNAHGRPLWIAPALQAARQLFTLLRPGCSTACLPTSELDSHLMEAPSS